MLQITQICGTEMKKKKFIIDSLVKHFSTSKYMNYEEVYMDNIMIEEKTVGRKYFDTYYIKDREDIINLLRISKSSKMLKYIGEILTKYEFQKELESIEQTIDSMYRRINENMCISFGSLILDYDVQKLWDMIQSSQIRDRNGREVEELSNYELLSELIKLLGEMQEYEPQKQLIVFENIDHFLMVNEYKDIYNLMKHMTSQFDLWFLCTISLEGYVVFEEQYIEGINIINDVVYTLTQMLNLKEFVERSYPCYKQFEIDVLEKWLGNIVHKIGKNNVESDLRSNVLLKLMNESLCMNYRENAGLNSMENSFLLERKKV